MKNILLASLCLLFTLPGFSQLNMTFQSTTTYDQSLNDVWHYASGGNEYALVGLRNGVGIIDVTNPAAPVKLGIADGPPTSWRDIKTSGDRAFVTNENSQGILIIELGNLPTPLTEDDYFYWNPTIPGIGTINRCHNIYIDEAGVGYLSGCNRNNGAPIFIDCTTLPDPTYLGATPAPSSNSQVDYAHDAYAFGDVMYSSNIHQGELRVFDVSDKTNATLLGTQNTPFNFTHNAWLDDAGEIIYTTDEKSNASVAAYDVSDPTDITYLDEFRPLSTVGNGEIPHNVHVIDDYLVISYYTYGVTIVDASVPDNLIEVGNYDTHPSTGCCFNGAWGADPFLPSGNILVSDQTEGCFVLTPTYVRAARLHGNVKDQVTGDNLNNADISITTSELHEGVTDFLGNYKTGLAAAGTYTVTYTAHGYQPKTVTVTLTNGVITVQDIELLAEGALDIDLISFEARLVNRKDVTLDWSALSNDDVIDFEIERSIDGVNFEMVGQQTDRTPSLTGKSYTFTDVSVPQEKLLYRLKMIEPDRSFTYSTLRSVDNTKGTSIEIGIFPNPVEAGKTLLFQNTSGISTRDMYFQLFSSAGMEVAQFAFPEDAEEINFNTNELSKGIYFVKVMNDGIVLKIEKIVVN